MAKIYKASKNKNYTQDLNKNDDFEETVINIFLFFFFHFPRIYFKITFFEIVWLLCFERESSSIRRLYTASVFIIIRCCALLFLWHKMVLSFINDERNGQKKNTQKDEEKEWTVCAFMHAKTGKNTKEQQKIEKPINIAGEDTNFFFSSCSLSFHSYMHSFASFFVYFCAPCCRFNYLLVTVVQRLNNTFCNSSQHRLCVSTFYLQCFFFFSTFLFRLTNNREWL